jgi:hypothetical protein
LLIGAATAETATERQSNFSCSPVAIAMPCVTAFEVA